MKTIFIIGGYGSIGKCFTELFLLKSLIQAKLIIAGRRIKQAQDYAKYLSHKYTIEVGSAYCDPTIPSTLSIIQGSTMVMVLAPNGNQVHAIAQACIQYKCDYYDIIYSSPKVRTLKAFSKQIIDKSLLFVTDGGYHPGMPGIFTRYALNLLPNAIKVETYSLFKQQFQQYDVQNSTWDGFVNELTHYEGALYRKGKKVSIPMMSSAYMKKINFGKYGAKRAVVMGLEELAEVAKVYPNVEEVSFYVSAFNGITNNIVIPFIFLAGRCLKKLSRRLFAWSILKTEPPYIATMRTDAMNAAKDHVILEATHEDGYVLTAIAVYAFVKQYLSNDLPKKGLFTQGMVCNPCKFVEDSKSMGMKMVEVRYKELQQ